MSRRIPSALQNLWWGFCDFFCGWGWGIAIVIAYLLFFMMNEAPAEDVCFENGDEPVKPEYVVSNMLFTVNWFNTAEELEAVVSALGYEVDESLELSECEVHPEQDIGWCELWLVIPKTVIGDPFMDSIGHEAAHGFFGAYHK